MSSSSITPRLRGILLNWLIEVHLTYGFMPRTLYLGLLQLASKPAVKRARVIMCWYQSQGLSRRASVDTGPQRGGLQAWAVTIGIRASPREGSNHCA
ncbi:hypothetical protein QN277_009334 [Acacia crassicarpa]|uniref:B-like cyclin n=1 Tax=Acacia crassicarpa TaxID=499986 RepID=A0AAE1M8E5_9FABA|nr:hypothetical protein QN277_009334 [Acacia crassicarpa]